MGITAIAVLSSAAATSLATAAAWSTFAIAMAGAVAGMIGRSIGSAIFGGGQKKAAGSQGYEPKDRKQMIRSSVAPRTTVYGHARVSGPIVFAASTGPKNQLLHLVIAIAGHEIDGVEEIWFDNQPVVVSSDGVDLSDPYNGQVLSAPYFAGPQEDGTMGSWAYVYPMLGSPDQTVHPYMYPIADQIGWSADHRLRGIAYLYVRLDYNPDVFVTGIPNISAVVRGKKIYDPRYNVTQWTDNWALIIRDWLVSQEGLRCQSSEIVSADLIESANYSDTLLTLPDGSTHKRYTINGVISTEERPIDILDELLDAGAGSLVYTQGSYRILAGMDHAAGRELTIGDLRGSLRVQPRVSRSSLVNSIKATYINKAVGWAEGEILPFSVPEYVSQDGGETIYADLKFHFTTNPHIAKHLGIVHLKNSRQAIVVEALLNLRGFQYSVGDVVPVTIAQLGWSQKKFRVINWRLAQDGAGVDLTLKEHAGADYDYDPSVHSVYDVAPDTNLPDPRTISPPASVSISESLYLTVGDSIKSRASVEWSEPIDAVAVQYQLAWKIGAYGATRYVLTTYTEAQLDDMAPGVLYCKVRARNSLGVWSSWSGEVSQQLYGKTAPPPAPDTFSLAITGNGSRQFIFALNDPPIDLAGFQIRYNPGSVALAWGSQTPVHDGTLKTSPYETGGFFDGEFSFTVRSVDTSGNLSATGRSLTVALPPPLNSVLLASENAREEVWLG